MNHERDYLERTITTVRNHSPEENSWVAWANLFADEIERLWGIEEQLEAAQRRIAELEQGLDLAIEIQNERVEQLEAAERALADAEKIIESRTGKGSWVGSLVLAKLRGSNPASRQDS